MVRIIILIGLLFFSLPIKAQIKSTEENTGLKGVVHRFREETRRYSYIDNKIKIDNTVTHTELYDRNGNTLESSSGENEYRVTFKRNKDGYAVEQIDYAKDGKISSKTITTFDDDGKRNRVISYNGDGSIRAQNVYVYDSDGRCIEEAILDANGKNQWAVTYRYDEKGRVLESIHLGSDRSITNRRVYEYDKKENKYTVNLYSRNGSLTEREVRWSSANDDKEEWRTYNADDSLKYGMDFLRNNNGDLVEEIEYRDNGCQINKTVYKYEYDPKGNWIIQRGYSVQQSESEEEVLQLSQEVLRTISYYED